MRENQQYFSLVYGVVDLEESELVYANAGHPAIIHLSKEAGARMLDCDGYPIGMMEEHDEVQQEAVPLAKGDRLIFHSDGLSDSMSEAGEVFGAARIIAAAQQGQGVALDLFTQSLLEESAKWHGGCDPGDDTSIVAIELA